LLGRCSITWATPPALFALVILKIRVSLFCPCQTGSPGLWGAHIYGTWHSWDGRHVPPYPAIGWDKGLMNFLPVMFFMISASQLARITDMNHHNWLEEHIF
jgi:hypothetical protein